MPDYTEKYLIWNGGYAPDDGDDNQAKYGEKSDKSYLQEGNKPQRTWQRALEVEIGETLHIMTSSISVRIISVDQDFIPILGHCTIRVRLKRLHNIGYLVLRIYDKDDHMVYQEFLSGEEVKQLPNVAPPTHWVPSRFYKQSAYKDQNPYKVRVWVGKKTDEYRPDFLKVKMVQKAASTDIDAIVIPLDAKTGVPGDLGATANPNDTIASRAGTVRRWDRFNWKDVVTKQGQEWRLGDRAITHPYYIVARTTDKMLKVSTITAPPEVHGVACHDQSAFNGKAQTKAHPLNTPRNIGQNAIGLNQTQVKAPHVRVVSRDIQAAGLPGKGVNSALTEALTNAPLTPPVAKSPEEKRSDYFTNLPLDITLYSLTLNSKPKQGASLADDAIAKARHLFDCVAKAAPQIPDPADALRIFLAPEFYFTHPDRPYNKNECNAILDEIKALSKKYPNWMFVSGSIWWEDRMYREADRGLATGGKQIGTYLSDGSVKKETKVDGEYVRVVHNLTPIIMNGVLVHTYMKVQPSTIDGLRKYSSADQKAVELTNDINNNRPVAVDTETWDRWNSLMTGALVKTDETSFFTAVGIRFGIEVCLDHLVGVMRHEYDVRFPGGNGLDIHLLVAAGMFNVEAKRACLACNKESNESAAHCEHCNCNFGEDICPNCKGNVSPFDDECANCGQPFTSQALSPTHTCLPFQNAPTDTNCQHCNALLDRMKPVYNVVNFPAPECPSCGNSFPLGTMRCNACKQKRTHTGNFTWWQCVNCSKYSIPNKPKCWNCNKIFVNNYNILNNCPSPVCPTCNKGAAPGTTNCSTCMQVLTPPGSYWECVNCNTLSPLNAPQCTNAGCSIDFTEVYCYHGGCNKMHPAGTVVCPDCGHDYNPPCPCPPHNNLPGSTTCGQCHATVQAPALSNKMKLPQTCARCYKEYAKNAVNCASCGLDFTRPMCLGCKANVNPTDTVCAGCGKNLQIHKCHRLTDKQCQCCGTQLASAVFEVQKNVNSPHCTPCILNFPPGTANCSNCTNPLTGNVVVDWWKCYSCNAYSPPGSLSCSGCTLTPAAYQVHTGVDSGFCWTCWSYYPPGTANCPKCLTPITGTGKTTWWECLACHVYSLPGSEKCGGCSRDFGRCNCAGITNPVGSQNCTNCGDSLMLKASSTDQNIHGNLIHIVARDGGYFLRNDGAAVMRDKDNHATTYFSEANRITRRGNVQNEDIKIADLQRKPESYRIDNTHNAPALTTDTIMQHQKLWSDARRSSFDDDFVVESFLKRADVQSAVIVLPGGIVPTIKTLEIGKLPDPRFGQVWNMPAVQNRHDLLLQPLTSALVSTRLNATDLGAIFGCPDTDPSIPPVLNSTFGALPGPEWQAISGHNTINMEISNLLAPLWAETVGTHLSDPEINTVFIQPLSDVDADSYLPYAFARLPEPFKTQILASAEYQNAKTAYVDEAVNAVVIYDIINDL